MLDIRPNCEACDKELSPGSTDVFICSFECTFCKSCAESRFNFDCPNCGGNLVTRPSRSDALLARHPASTKRVNKDHA